MCEDLEKKLKDLQNSVKSQPLGKSTNQAQLRKSIALVSAQLMDCRNRKKSKESKKEIVTPKKDASKKTKGSQVGDHGSPFRDASYKHGGKTKCGCKSKKSSGNRHQHD